MQLVCKFNKGIRLLLCVIDIFSNCTWVIPLIDKKRTTVTNAFQKVLDKSKCKPNKIRVDKVSEVYNISMKFWLQDNNIEMHSVHNEEKAVVAERFIRTLKTKIYKYMTSVLKNVYVDKINYIVNRCNNTCHRTIKMKPIYEDNIYVDFDKKK